jgi:hypothetical protein
MSGWTGPVRNNSDLGGDSPGAQPFPSIAGGGGTPAAIVKVAAYTAKFGETVFCDPTSPSGSFAVTLPRITPGSLLSQIVIQIVTFPIVGMAAPQNVLIMPDPADSIGGGGSLLLSGRSTIVLQSDGGLLIAGHGIWNILSTPSCPSTPATLAAGSQTLTRLGPYTRYEAPAVLGADVTYMLDETQAQGGDILELSIPSHDAHSIAVQRTMVPTILATYAPTLTGGGRFIYRGDGQDWDVLSAGASTT